MFQNAKYQKQKFRDAIGSVRRTVTVRFILQTNDRDNTSYAHQPNTCFYPRNEKKCRDEKASTEACFFLQNWTYTKS